MRKARTLSAVALGLALHACLCAAPAIEGSGVSATEARPVGDFDRVVVEGAVTLDLRVGGEPSCTVTTDDNLLRLVDTEVRDGALHIVTTAPVAPRTTLSVLVTTPALAALTIRGAAEGFVRDAAGEKLEVRANGAADLTVEGLEVDRLEVRLNGAGELTAAGRADAIDIQVAGAGTAALAELCALTAQVRVNGAGSLKLAVAEKIEASIHGAGSIEYLGDPSAAPTVAGFGSISRGGPLPARCAGGAAADAGDRKSVV